MFKDFIIWIYPKRTSILVFDLMKFYYLVVPIRAVMLVNIVWAILLGIYSYEPSLGYSNNSI